MVEEGQLRDMGGWRVGVFMRGTEKQSRIANDNRFITEIQCLAPIVAMGNR